MGNYFSARQMLSSSVNWLPLRWRYWIKNIPGIAPLQRWLINRFLSGRPFIHAVNAGPAAGLLFEVILPADKAIWAGTYETEFTNAIMKNIRAGDTCYDVGGYHGYMAGVMAQAGAAGVYTFEPLEENQESINRFLGLNSRLRITLVPVALSSNDGMAQLKIMRDSSMGKLEDSRFQTDAEIVREISVPVRRIDSLVKARELPAPNIVKIDVEGAEVEVLRGARETIRAGRPRIFIEAHGSDLELACRHELEQLGYDVNMIESSEIDAAHTRHLICLPR